MSRPPSEPEGRPAERPDRPKTGSGREGRAVPDDRTHGVPARAVGADRRLRRAVADEEEARLVERACPRPRGCRPRACAGAGARGGRAPAGSRSPTGSRRRARTCRPASARPSLRSTVNIGCRTSTPRASAARAHGVQCMPVTEMTLPGGSPRRTRSSTPAIAATRAGMSKSSSTHSGSRRVTQNVSATREISSSSCTAEMPAPTTTTRCRRTRRPTRSRRRAAGGRGTRSWPG